MGEAKLRTFTAQEVELAVARHFDYRTNLIVPNVTSGMNLDYEADIVVLRPSGWAIEVEIKVSAADIRADLRKKHQHDSQMFKELWFAVPEALKDDPNIPDRAGILSVRETNDGAIRARQVRRAQRRKDAVKLQPKEVTQLYRIASMRTWKLKNDIAKMKAKKGK